MNDCGAKLAGTGPPGGVLPVLDVLGDVFVWLVWGWLGGLEVLGGW
ncbi:MAG: hypothetical protein M3076_18530 [Actinomycetota bacterium]|nr:hypothetical protein [Actinomycetota bacterium]